MKRVLVVDDYDDVHHVMELIAEEDQVEVSGITSFNDLDETLSQFRPDLIIFDVKVGTVDGREICSQLQANDATRHIKIALTSNQEITLGGTACQPHAMFDKPFDPKVREEILELLDLYRP